MTKSILDLPTPVHWVGLFLTMNGVLATLCAITWALLWLVGFESLWTSTVMLTASLLFIEFHFARRIVFDLKVERMIARTVKDLSKAVARKAGKEDA
ncbi:hypothetical protein HFO84_35645 [Rhizobium leguminosarum]|uniref:hypothetical protein n=1 Tax=Rhizobium leguminosarum TaxID=384 RepID=UPI001C93A1C9|nr:hypothetical protein [Rhizobium leguminosarum]MBY5482607.1 hypothetical protein [Rhizobium leguminosarum]